VDDFPAGPPPVEPSADHRSLAIQVFQFHQALTGAGFDQAEAMYLTGVWINSLVTRGQQ
jgi:hypothetical protein